MKRVNQTALERLAAEMAKDAPPLAAWQIARLRVYFGGIGLNVRVVSDGKANAMGSGNFNLLTDVNGIEEIVISEIPHNLASRLKSNLQSIYQDETLRIEKD